MLQRFAVFLLLAAVSCSRAVETSVSPLGLDPIDSYQGNIKRAEAAGRQDIHKSMKEVVAESAAAVKAERQTDARVASESAEAVKARNAKRMDKVHKQNKQDQMKARLQAAAKLARKEDVQAKDDKAQLAKAELVVQNSVDAARKNNAKMVQNDAEAAQAKTAEKKAVAAANKYHGELVQKDAQIVQLSAEHEKEESTIRHLKAENSELAALANGKKPQVVEHETAKAKKN